MRTRNWITLVAAAAVLQFSSCLAVGDTSQTDIENHWLMMVSTDSTDPAREAEFNAWYDDIDIPDVLEVPGYMRARRGLGQRLPGFPSVDVPADQGKYVALYDIETEDIDRTIIEMLMASRKMEMTGRSTDLLQVTERVYYRQHAPTYEAPKPMPSGNKDYLLLVRVDCCRDEATEKQLNDWYDNTHIPDIMKTPGFMRATRYELYWVLMVYPKDIPNYLTVFEIEAESAEQALGSMQQVVDEMEPTDRMSELYPQRGSTMYLKIKDVGKKLQ